MPWLIVSLTLLMIVVFAMIVRISLRGNGVRWRNFLFLQAVGIFSLMIGCNSTKDESTPKAMAIVGEDGLGLGSEKTCSFSANVGEVLQGTVIRQSFHVSNPTTKDIKVVGVSSNCGCSPQVTLTSEVIPVRGTTDVTVSLPTTRIEGSFDRRFILNTDSDDPRYREIFINLNGTVESLCKVTPPELFFWTIRFSDNIESLNVTLTSRLIDLTSALTSITADNDYIKVKVVQKEKGIIKCQIRLIPTMQEGPFWSNILFLFSDPRLREVRVPVHGRRVGLFNLTPSEAILRPSGDLQPRVVRLRLQSSDGTAFGILALDAPVGISMSWEKANKKGSIYLLSARFGADLPKLPPHSEIKMKTDRPGGSVHIPVLDNR